MAAELAQKGRDDVRILVVRVHERIDQPGDAAFGLFDGYGMLVHPFGEGCCHAEALHSAISHAAVRMEKERHDAFVVGVPVRLGQLTQSELSKPPKFGFFQVIRYHDVAPRPK
jgi:hypothetical protein